MTTASRAPSPYAMGVDLGTTSVAAAVCRGMRGRPSMVTLGGQGVVLPTVAFVDDEGRVCYGEPAVRHARADPGRAAVGFSRRLGDPTPLRLAERRYSATWLVTGLLTEVLEVVTRAEGTAPAHVVITYPATWGPLRRRLLEAVARESGAGDAELVPAPVAAALHHVHQHGAGRAEVLAVYDLGGGTFELTAVRADPDHVEILGRPEGIDRLGGSNFDDALVSHVDRLVDGALSDADPADPVMTAVRAQVRRDCVLAKEHLSTDTAALVPVLLPDRHLQITVTRADFEDLIRPPVESTVRVAERAVRYAELDRDRLDQVLLAGGSSRIPLVSEVLAESLGRPTPIGTHPEFAVALGAARIAARRGTWTADGAAPPLVPRPSSPDSVFPRPPLPDVAIPRPPVPDVAIPRPPVPVGVPRPPLPDSVVPRPPVPDVAIPRPPVPVGVPRPPVPDSVVPRPPVPDVAIPRPPVPVGVRPIAPPPANGAGPVIPAELDEGGVRSGAAGRPDPDVPGPPAVPSRPRTMARLLSAAAAALALVGVGTYAALVDHLPRSVTGTVVGSVPGCRTGSCLAGSAELDAPPSRAPAAGADQEGPAAPARPTLHPVPSRPSAGRSAPISPPRSRATARFTGEPTGGAGNDPGREKDSKKSKKKKKKNKDREEYGP